MNSIEEFEEILRTEYPESKIELLRPETETGAWFLTISHLEVKITIEWREGLGFGISVGEDVYGEGADEVVAHLQKAVDKVVSMLSTPLITKLNAYLKMMSRDVPIPVTADWLKAAYSAGMLPKSALKDGVYYYGRCRNARVAKWDAKLGRFFYMRFKFGGFHQAEIYHPEDDNGFDLFVPIGVTEPKSTEIVC